MKERLIELLNEATDKNGIYLDKIADYLIANGVVVLPCKVGDKVYEINKDCLHCEHFKEYWRDDFACEREPEGSLFDLDYDKNCKYSIDEKPFDYPLIGYINKTVFLTREEAEKALQRKEDEGK